MSKLHSNVKAHKLSATKRIVQQAFDGRQFDTIWEEFDSTPLGIGAIAQVIPNLNIH
jgi:aarF domain-containing kinase